MTAAAGHPLRRLTRGAGGQPRRQHVDVVITALTSTDGTVRPRRVGEDFTLRRRRWLADALTPLLADVAPALTACGPVVVRDYQSGRRPDVVDAHVAMIVDWPALSACRPPTSNSYLTSRWQLRQYQISWLLDQRIGIYAVADELVHLSFSFLGVRLGAAAPQTPVSR